MTGKVVIIAGSPRGIGAGLVSGYQGQGWAVVASARTIKPSLDPGLLTVPGDIADPATADRIIDGALERFGRIDTLVNNAGVYLSKPFTDYTAADYATVTGVNLTGFFWVTQRAIAEMATRYGGHVVNVSATLAEVADSATPAVLAALTKGGLAAVDVQDLAGDVGRRLQEQNGVHHVADLAGPAERGKPAAQVLVAFRRLVRGLDDPRRDGVDPDADGGVLDGQ